jgi:hypothetical protein
MKTKINENKQESNFQIILNKDTFELLQKVRTQLFEELGFEPTNGQVVRHLIVTYQKDAN